jgi:hypothetical protein
MELVNNIYTLFKELYIYNNIIMENIVISLIYSFTFIYLSKYILSKHKDLFMENNNNEELEEQFKSICEEITQMKSLFIKSNETIKRIVKKLPFNGEEWIQEFIREEINKNMESMEAMEKLKTFDEFINLEQSFNM